MIIIVGNQKGGTGKSLTTLLMANTLSQKPFNYKVTVIDCDPQKSLIDARNFDTKHFDNALSYDILDYNIKTLQSKINDLDKTNDFIFIDTGGKLDINKTSDQEKALHYADMVLIPFVGGLFNLDATVSYLRFILNIKRERPEDRPLEILGFINRYRERSRTNQYLIQDIDNLKKALPIQFMKTRLKDYTLFADTDTMESLYQANSTDNAKVNLVLFMNEFLKRIS